MAQMISASIYGSDGNNWKTSSLGRTLGFAVVNIQIAALSPAVSYDGVACNAIIEVLPTGLIVDKKLYYTPTAASALITAAG